MNDQASCQIGNVISARKYKNKNLVACVVIVTIIRFGDDNLILFHSNLGKSETKLHCFVYFFSDLVGNLLNFEVQQDKMYLCNFRVKYM